MCLIGWGRGVARVGWGRGSWRGVGEGGSWGGAGVSLTLAESRVLENL